MMTAHGAIDVAIDAMKRGAYDFVSKPFAANELRALVQKALEKRDIVVENEALRAKLGREQRRDIIYRSEAMRRVFDLTQSIARARTTVLITGEGGTVFLDEVGELALATQVKLLRVLQERKVRSVGATAEVAVDVRVVAATNRNVEDDVKAGRFRQDLYYRLNVIRVQIPPLRDRREDVRPLADHFLHQWAAEQGKEINVISPDALRSLEAYAFPGNVRELENVMERAVALAKGPTIGLGDLPPELAGAASLPSPGLVDLPDAGCNLDDVMGEVERRLVLQALERTGGVRTQAAKLLGVTLRSLRYRLQKHAIGDENDDEGEPSSESGIEIPR